MNLRVTVKSVVVSVVLLSVVFLGGAFARSGRTAEVYPRNRPPMVIKNLIVRQGHIDAFWREGRVKLLLKDMKKIEFLKLVKGQEHIESRVTLNDGRIDSFKMDFHVLFIGKSDFGKWEMPLINISKIVFNPPDKCPGTPKGAEVDDRGCWVLKNVKFDTDKWDIKKQYYPILENVVTVMRENPSLRVEVQGHTDIRWSEKHNQKLSENRARSVIEYLVRKGIESSRLSAVGFGPRKPIASNATEAGMAKNRRVELRPIR